jgi:hypothetical protein
VAFLSKYFEDDSIFGIFILLMKFCNFGIFLSSFVFIKILFVLGVKSSKLFLSSLIFVF